MLNSDVMIRNNKSVKEILLWRLSTAVVWSIISQIIILVTFLTIINFHLVNPIVGLTTVFQTLFSWRIIFLLAPLSAVIFAQGVICSKEYVSKNPYLSTRFSILLNIISLRNIVLCILHILSGLMTTWLYLLLLNLDSYNSLIKYCYKSTVWKCLNETNLFLTMSGVFIGFFYFMKEHLVGIKYIYFPVIEQNSFLQVKSTAVNLLVASVFNSILPVGYYIGLYYFYGSSLRNYFLNFLSLDFEDERLDTIHGLIQLKLIICCWLFSSLFLFTMYTMELIFKINLTRRHTFPIVCTSQAGLTLDESISLSKIPIIQHLACLDLFKLAMNDVMRRKILFEISQPGGHPYNWNSIVTSCLSLINEYTESLAQASSDDINEIEKISETITEPKYDVLIQSPTEKHARLRNMRYLAYQEPLENTNEPQKIEIKSNLAEIIQNVKQKFIFILYKIPGVNFFFGELRDAKIKYILTQGQPVVWTVQGLSLLVSKSFFEDNYGIVHKDLTTILISLVRLSQVVDKVSKIPIYCNRKISRRDEYYGQIQSALKSATKRSLYNICNTFGSYIDELTMPADVKSYIFTNIVSKKF